MGARLSRQTHLRWGPQTSVDGNSLERVRVGTATGNGAAGGTSIVDTNADSGTADLYSGRYMVQVTSGNAKGQWRRITDDDGSGTITVETAYSYNGSAVQITTGTTYSIHKLPDSGVVVCAGDTASTTQFNDDYRDEDDSFWVNYEAIPITGNLIGETSTVSAFDKSGGASEGLFTVDTAFSEAPATGDVILLRKFLDFEPGSLTLTKASLPRLGGRQNFSRGKSRVGASSGGFSFRTRVYPSGSLAGSGSNANAGSIDGLLKACGYSETVDTSSTAGAGSSTTAVKLATGSHENHTIGGAIIHNGNMRFITDITDGGAGVDTLTVSPALPVAPATSDVIYAVRTYKPSEDGDTTGVQIEIEVDGVLHHFVGCKGNVTFDAGSAGHLVASWDFTCTHHFRYLVASSYDASSAYSTALAPLTHDAEVYLDTTKTDVGGLTWSLNAQHQLSSVAGATALNFTTGPRLVDEDPRGAFTELLDSSGTGLPPSERFDSENTFSLFAYWGTHGDAVGFRAAAAQVVEHPDTGSSNDQVAMTQAWMATDAGTQPYDSDSGGVDDTFTRIGNLNLFLP